VNDSRRAVLLFLFIYGLITVPWLFWPFDNVAWGITVLALYSLMAIGLATDTTEVILALIWPRRTLPASSEDVPRELAAVLMTVCNDASEHCLKYLFSLADAGYNIYLLDDSLEPTDLSTAPKTRVVQVRRPTIRGAKGGNLNNWLRSFGNLYRYALLLDADSIVSVEAADALLLTAEHEANSGVAVFQSKVECRKSRSLFANLLSTGNRPRARVLERVHGSLGLVLSFGHNQLIRLAPVLKIGGFDESLTSEDTALSLQLAARGWRTELVDVWSFDAEPTTVTAYVRRTLRWARQTVELFHFPWYSVPLRLKLLLCRHLLSYLLPIVGLALLIMSLWRGPDSFASVLRFLWASLSFQSGYVFYGLIIWLPLLVFALFITLQTTLARLEGVSWSFLLLRFFLGNSYYPVLLLPLVGSMIASAVGFKVRFHPTNSKYAMSKDRRLSRQLLLGLSTGIVLAVLLAGVLHRPASLLVGFNVLWITQMLLSPIGLLVLRLTDRETRNNKPA